MSTLNERDERLWGLALHIVPLFGFSILFPLAILIAKPGNSDFVYHHAKQSLIFNIAFVIAAIITVILCFALVGFLLLIPLVLVGYVLPIIAGVKAYEGKLYTYPVVGAMF